jgi:hypothetical protein
VNRFNRGGITSRRWPRGRWVEEKQGQSKWTESNHRESYDELQHTAVHVDTRNEYRAATALLSALAMKLAPSDLHSVLSDLKAFVPLDDAILKEAHRRTGIPGYCLSVKRNKGNIRRQLVGLAAMLRQAAPHWALDEFGEMSDGADRVA